MTAPLPAAASTGLFRNVLDAARARVAYVFDRFGRVVVSVSGGKDSTVLYWLAIEEAERRGRQVEVFFLDQEAEYQGSIDLIDQMMRHPAVLPRWVQVPLRMTNATSHVDLWFRAWHPEEEALWLRPQSPLSLKAVDLPGAPDRFYAFFPWWEARDTTPTAHLVGLRSRESLNRWRAVAKHPGFEDVWWSTKTKAPASFRFYPLFDWNVGDVWKYIADTGRPYNRVYDQMIALRGADMRATRVSCLVHEQSYRALTQLHELEPATYAALVRRLGGVHSAALYAEDDYLYDARKRPEGFATWRSYRDYLVETTPLAEGRMAHFLKRLERQPDDEATCREQVRQLLISDWENNVPVRRRKAADLRACWWDRL